MIVSAAKQALKNSNSKTQIDSVCFSGFHALPQEVKDEICKKLAPSGVQENPHVFEVLSCCAAWPQAFLVIKNKLGEQGCGCKNVLCIFYSVFSTKHFTNDEGKPNIFKRLAEKNDLTNYINYTLMCDGAAAFLVSTEPDPNAPQCFEVQNTIFKRLDGWILDTTVDGLTKLNLYAVDCYGGYFDEMVAKAKIPLSAYSWFSLHEPNPKRIGKIVKEKKIENRTLLCGSKYGNLTSACAPVNFVESMSCGTRVDSGQKVGVFCLGETSGSLAACGFIVLKKL